MKTRLTNAFQNFWDSIIEQAPSITIGIILFALMIIIGLLFRSLSRNRLKKRMDDPLLANFIGRVIFLLFLIVGFVIFLNQLGLGKAASSLLAGAGVSALVLGFAFKDIGENFLAGFFLAFSRPFKIGDILQIADVTGTVKALDFRNTHIRTFDGRDIFVPNSMLIKNPLTNFTRDGLMRHDFILGIDYGDDISEATRVTLDELSTVTNIAQGDEIDPFVIIDDFGTSTINMRIHFWINTYDFLGSTTVLKSSVMQKVLNRLSSEGFTMPADIVELKIYQEGKPIPVLLTDAQKKITTKKEENI